ncbi:unnamed protein product, partial [Iphiclides podalirius]
MAGAARLSSGRRALARRLTQRDLFVRPHGLPRNVRGAGPAPRSTNYECQMLSHATVRRAVRTPLRRSS